MKTIPAPNKRSFSSCRKFLVQVLEAISHEKIKSDELIAAEPICLTVIREGHLWPLRNVSRWVDQVIRLCREAGLAIHEDWKETS